MPRDLLPWTRFHLLEFSPPPSRPISYEFVNGFIHWWGQSPHDVITTQWLHLWHWLHWGPSHQHMRVWGTLQIQIITMV
jgi:hypothetical protein